MADSAPSSSYHRSLDRLTNLPEHILLHILSFLPTKIAVKTSVLSKPWQHLWTLVPAIDLDYVSCREAVEDSLLLRKILVGNKAPIMRRFRLGGQQYCTTSTLAKWLLYATERNVEELDLDFQDVYDDNVPSGSRHSTFVFRFTPESCKTLVIMKVMMTTLYDLHLLIGGHVVDDLYFPSLKIMHLKKVGFESREPSISGFFSSRFPLLEELVVDDCGALLHDLDLNISLPKLRRLEIESIKKYTLNLEAPCLQYLLLGYCDTRGFRVGNLHSLVETNVDLSYNNYEGLEYDEYLLKINGNEYGESVINFVNALSNVRMLNLSRNTMLTLSSHSLLVTDRIKPFRNLVELDLELDGSALCILMFLLSKFENLEHLKIINRCNEDDKTDYSFTPPTHVPKCLTHHLKTFCFRYFNCLKYETEFTIYILKNSLVLENVKIRFRPRLVWQEGYDSQTILSTTSRGSLECRLEFGQEHCYGRPCRCFGAL